MADLVKDFTLTHDDGFTSLLIADTDFDQVAETRKDKDGNIVETGVTKRTFHYRVSQSSIDKGEGAVAVRDGEARVMREIKVVMRDVDESALSAKREALRWSNFAKDFRRFAGLSKSAKAIDAGDKLTQKDVENFINGFRKVKGKFYEELPKATQDAVTKAYSDLLKKANSAAAKLPTMAQLAELAAEAAAQGVPLGDDWHKAYEAAKAKAAKLREGKAKNAALPASKELTEQAFEG